MKTSERFDRIEAALGQISEANVATNRLSQQTAANLHKLSQVIASIAESVAAHDEQIENLVKVPEIQQQRWEQLQREWQAYLTTVHPRP